MGTSFSTIYDTFLNKITDDLYTVMSLEEVEMDLEKFLDAAVVRFEFPKIDVKSRDNMIAMFYNDLGYDEIEILAELMKMEWIKRQINTIEITKMKYSDKDFKLTSQANHLAKLLELKKEQESDIRKLQRLYGRRNEKGAPNYSGLAGGGL